MKLKIIFAAIIAIGAIFDITRNSMMSSEVGLKMAVMFLMGSAYASIAWSLRK